jgi:hypothetical protein
VLLPFIKNEETETNGAHFRKLREKIKATESSQVSVTAFLKGIFQQVQAFQKISKMNLYFQKI